MKGSMNQTRSYTRKEILIKIDAFRDKQVSYEVITAKMLLDFIAFQENTQDLPYSPVPYSPGGIAQEQIAALRRAAEKGVFNLAPEEDWLESPELTNEYINDYPNSAIKILSNK